MVEKAEMFASSIVCLGAFNSPIFSPDWLERQRLIGEQDAEVARKAPSYVVSGQVTQYETSWFAIQVLENQFSLTSKGALTGAFKDLFVSILHLLPQTPITAIGINFMGHFKMAKLDDLHQIGDALTPKAIWRELFPSEDSPPGLASLTIQVRKLDRKEITAKGRDWLNITIQPSAIIAGGVYMAYNDHHDIPLNDDSSLTAAERAAQIVEERWETSNDDALKVFNGILSKTLSSSK